MATIWLREIAGWVLLGIGLSAFAVCYFVFLLQRRIVEAVVLGGVGFIIFRSGLQLLKVAIAARIAVQNVKAVPKPKTSTPPAIRVGNPSRPSTVELTKK